MQNGRIPVKEFIDNQQEEVMMKIFWILEIIESGEIISNQFFKKISNNIWEVRIRYKSNIYRILGFFDKGNLIVLNHAFTKKTQKLPKKEILIADERRKDYLRRKENE